jgi:hypothetical protein
MTLHVFYSAKRVQNVCEVFKARHCARFPDRPKSTFSALRTSKKEDRKRAPARVSGPLPHCHATALFARGTANSCSVQMNLNTSNPKADRLSSDCHISRCHDQTFSFASTESIAARIGSAGGCAISRRRGCGGWNARRACGSQYGRPLTLPLPQK